MFKILTNGKNLNLELIKFKNCSILNDVILLESSLQNENGEYIEESESEISITDMFLDSLAFEVFLHSIDLQALSLGIFQHFVAENLKAKLEKN